MSKLAFRLRWIDEPSGPKDSRNRLRATIYSSSSNTTSENKPTSLYSRTYSKGFLSRGLQARVTYELLWTACISRYKAIGDENSNSKSAHKGWKDERTFNREEIQ